MFCFKFIRSSVLTVFVFFFFFFFTTFFYALEGMENDGVIPAANVSELAVKWMADNKLTERNLIVSVQALQATDRDAYRLAATALQEFHSDAGRYSCSPLSCALNFFLRDKFVVQSTDTSCANKFGTLLEDFAFAYTILKEKRDLTDLCMYTKYIQFWVAFMSQDVFDNTPDLSPYMSFCRRYIHDMVCLPESPVWPSESFELLITHFKEKFQSKSFADGKTLQDALRGFYRDCLSGGDVIPEGFFISLFTQIIKSDIKRSQCEATGTPYTGFSCDDVDPVDMNPALRCDKDDDDEKRDE